MRWRIKPALERTVYSFRGTALSNLKRLDSSMKRSCGAIQKEEELHASLACRNALLADVIDLGLLAAVTPKGPVSLRFPENALQQLFPRLYPKV